MRFALAAALALTALSPVLASAGEQSTKPPAPQPGTFEAVIANNPVSAILEGPKLWATPTDPKDWVKSSRPKQEPDFMPVGITPPSHKREVHSQSELDALKADLDATQAKMQDMLAHKPVVNSIGPAAANADANANAATSPPQTAKPKKTAKAKPKPISTTD